MIAVNPQLVIEEARRLLERSDRPIARTLAVSDEFLQQGEWLHLVVTPREAGHSALDYVDEIETMEDELRKRFGQEILIVPSKP